MDLVGTDPQRCARLLHLVVERPHPSRAAALTALRYLAEHASFELRKHAIYDLGNCGDAAATPIIVAALDELAPEDWSAAAPLVITALGRCGDERALARLDALAAADHPYASCARAAAEKIRARLS